MAQSILESGEDSRHAHSCPIKHIERLSRHASSGRPLNLTGPVSLVPVVSEGGCEDRMSEPTALQGEPETRGITFTLMVFNPEFSWPTSKVPFLG